MMEFRITYQICGEIKVRYCEAEDMVEAINRIFADTDKEDLKTLRDLSVDRIAWSAPHGQ